MPGCAPLLSVKEGMIEAMSEELNANVREWVSRLRSPDNKVAYCALKELVEASGRSIVVYAHLDSFINMMRDYTDARGHTIEVNLTTFGSITSSGRGVGRKNERQRLV